MRVHAPVLIEISRLASADLDDGQKMGFAEPSEALHSKRMPTVLRIGPYRFLFYASDGDEPIHVHVLRDDEMAKFWLQPVRLAVNIGFPSKELRQIEKLIEENKPEIERKWNEFFSRS